MALTKAQKAALMVIVKAEFGANARIANDRQHSVIRGSKRGGVFSFADTVKELNSCCGFVELSGLDLAGKNTPLHLALFKIWLDDLNTSGVIATTAVGKARQPLSITEQVLSAAGFKPVFRGENPNTNNHVTLWFLPIEESTLSLVTQPKEKVIAKPRSKSTRSR